MLKPALVRAKITLRLLFLRTLLSGKCDIDSAIAVTGSPRSGTTWLANTLSAIPKSSVLFEPINVKRVPQAEAAGFTMRTYLPASADFPAGEEYLSRVFRGEVLNGWTAKQLTIRGAMSTEFLIVKFARANRLLPWLCEQFPIRTPVMIIRHPCAVVASQLRTGWWESWSESGPEKLLASSVVADYPALGPIMSRLETSEEFLAASWALDNFVALAAVPKRSWHLVTYEELTLNRGNELRRIFRRWDLPVPADLDSRMMLESSTTRSGVSGLSGWQQQLSQEQVRRILAVTSQFGLDFYGGDPEPDYDTLYSSNLPDDLRALGAGLIA